MGDAGPLDVAVAHHDHNAAYFVLRLPNHKTRRLVRLTKVGTPLEIR